MQGRWPPRVDLLKHCVQIWCAPLWEWSGPNLLCLTRVQVHVGWLPGGTAILAFRGTESAQDGLQDVKILRKNVDYMQEIFPGVQAHTGDQNVHFCGS